jgi:hypothetical protein
MSDADHDDKLHDDDDLGDVFDGNVYSELDNDFSEDMRPVDDRTFYDPDQGNNLDDGDEGYYYQDYNERRQMRNS